MKDIIKLLSDVRDLRRAEWEARNMRRETEAELAETLIKSFDPRALVYSGAIKMNEARVRLLLNERDAITRPKVVK